KRGRMEDEKRVNRTGDLGRVLAAGLLPAAAARLETRLVAEPDRASLWRRLGDIRRHGGEPSRAADAYERAAALDPRDIVSARALAILRGDPVPPTPSPWPVRHLRWDSFLPAGRLAELLAFAAGQCSAFEPTPVLANGENTLDPNVRTSRSCRTLDELGDWFEPLTRERPPDFGRALGEAPLHA